MEVLVPMRSDRPGVTAVFDNPTAVTSDFLIECCDSVGWRVPSMLGKVTGVKE